MARRDEGRAQRATTRTPEVIRRLAQAVAADIEGDRTAVLSFASWVSENATRTDALAVMAVELSAAAGYSPAYLRHWASMVDQQAARGRR